MKKYLYVVIAILTVFLAGCGDNASDITSAPAASIEETEKPELNTFYGLEQSSASEEITQGYTDEQLCNMAKIYYMNQHEYDPSCVTVDHVSGDIVTIHLYDVTNVMLDDGSTVGYTSTYDWYDINRYTAEGTNFFGEEINLAQ